MKNKHSIEKIVFYCRKGIIAQGDFLYYYKLASYIADNYPEYSVYCSFKANSFFMNEYTNPRVSIIQIDENNCKGFENAVFITAMNQFFYLLNDIRRFPKAKVLFLFLHPMTVKWFSKRVAKEHFDLNSLFKLIKKNSAYGFGDESIFLSTQRELRIKLEQKYFPVVVESEGNTITSTPKGLISEDTINIAWLGRLDGDKIYTVINLLDNVFDATKRKVSFHIIGDGSARHLINVNKYAPKIRVVFNSYLYGQDRDRYLIDNVDLVVAMGTSSLTAAKLGVPVILPIVSEKPFRDDKYLYLYETQNYCIGWTRDDIIESKCKTHMIEDILVDIYDEGRKREVGDMCAEYVDTIFSINDCMDRALPIILDTKLTVKKIRCNPSVLFHHCFFLMYKLLIKRDATYHDFSIFHDRYVKFMDLPVKTRFEKFSKKVLKRLKNKLKTLRR